jgi:hypothetical protein
MKGFRSLQLPQREIPSAGVIYPPNGLVAGYFHRHPDPAVPVYWLAGEMIPAVRRVIARYRSGSTATRMRRHHGSARRTWRLPVGRGPDDTTPESPSKTSGPVEQPLVITSAAGSP